MNGEPRDWQDGELRVVVNGEGQYSVWPIDREIPSGWRDAGKTGSQAQCLEYIEAVWIDICPLSARTKNRKD